MVEVATEVSFFKCVGTDNVDTIALFRITQPMGYVIGALSALLLLTYMPLEHAFVLFGIFGFIGIAPALYIQPSTSKETTVPYCIQSSGRC